MTIKNMNEYATAFNADVRFTPPKNVTENLTIKLKKKTFNDGKPMLIQLNDGTCKWARVVHEAAATAEVVNGEVILTGAYYLCDHCGKWAAVEECKMQGNGVACMICRDDTILCDGCGEWILEDDVVTVDDNYYCIECVDADPNIVYCERCEQYTFSDYGVYYVETRFGAEGWCKDCFEEHALYCYECSEAIPIDEAMYDDRYGVYYCPSCYENRPRDLIGDYHSGNPHGTQFYGEVTRDSYLQGYIGTEIEYFGHGEYIAEAIYDAVGGFDFCHFEDDSTVDVEVVTQPHTLEMMYYEEDRFRAMFDAVRNAGGRSQEGAGLHVHFSRTCFGETQEERAARISKVCMLFSNKDAFEALAKIAKRDDFYWCDRIEGSRVDIKQRADHVGGRHSVAVNLQHDATVEFRLGRSMDNWDDFIAWVEVLAWIVKKSADIEEAVATSLSNWIIDCPIHIMRTFNMNDIHVSELAKPLNISDYENIIKSLCMEVQEAHMKRSRVLRNIGLDDHELPRVPTMDDILAKVAATAMRKSIILG